MRITAATNHLRLMDSCSDVYWFVSAFSAKKTEKREPSAERLGHMILMAAGYILLFQRNDNWGVLNHRFLPDIPWIAWLGAAITFAGVLFAIWARWNLGKNWSAAVTIKQGHQIIRTGPYAYIRHPIYTGMLVAVIGSALASRRVSRFARFRNHPVRLLSKGAKRRKIPRRQFRRAISGAQAAHRLFSSAFFMK